MLPEHLQKELENVFSTSLNTRSYRTSIEELLSPRVASRIDPSPYYQRNLVWEPHKATYFIESVLLGTDIPPLVLFKSGDEKEILDGRQRYETLTRFANNEFRLVRRGLPVLPQLYNCDRDGLPAEFQDAFFEATIRVYEIEIVGADRFSPETIELVKKEIFRRYNTGITPLRSAEIANAVYDSDAVSRAFKALYRSDALFAAQVAGLFFENAAKVSAAQVMQFVRDSLARHRLPINYFGTGDRGAVLGRLYDIFVQGAPCPAEVTGAFAAKVAVVARLAECGAVAGTEPNRLFNACFLWFLHIAEQEGVFDQRVTDDRFLHKLLAFYESSREDFSEVDYNFSKKLLLRHRSFLDFVAAELELDLSSYRGPTPEAAQLRKELFSGDRAVVAEPQTLRITKADPQSVTVNGLLAKMNRAKYLVRPSYQRGQVIKKAKSSSIIESMLLGIPLPPLFIFRRADGVHEVVDGQQRLLSILSYVGGSYVNEHGESETPKNSGHGLFRPNILGALKGKRFGDLPAAERDRILDFKIDVIIIDGCKEPDFNPVELFIRLNNKPYPIGEHSFEMWNSWADRSIITKVREESARCRGWFYVKTPTPRSYGDRMENENLYATLLCLSYWGESDQDGRGVRVVLRGGRLVPLLPKGGELTEVIRRATFNEQERERVMRQFTAVRRFVANVRTILVDRDEAGDDYLRHRFDELLAVGADLRMYRRSAQDLGLLWKILSPLRKEMVNHRRAELWHEVQELVSLVKHPRQEAGECLAEFDRRLAEFHDNNRPDGREFSSQLRSDPAAVRRLIDAQGGVCGIGGAPLFGADDVEIDHITPLAIGGTDTIENLQAVHKVENRRKGCRPSAGGVA